MIKTRFANRSKTFEFVKETTGRGGQDVLPPPKIRTRYQKRARGLFNVDDEIELNGGCVRFSFQFLWIYSLSSRGSTVDLCVWVRAGLSVLSCSLDRTKTDRDNTMIIIITISLRTSHVRATGFWVGFSCTRTRDSFYPAASIGR